MIAKKLIPALVLVLTLAGFLTATARYHWWKKASPTPAVAAPLPAAVEEYRKILQRAHGTDSTSDLSGTIHIYDGENKNALKETKTFRYSRSGTQYYMQLSYLQTFCNGKVLLQLDTVHKRILLSRPAVTATPGNNTGRDPINALFSDTARFKVSGIVSSGQGGERALQLQSDFNPQIRAYRLYYDTLTYSLHHAEIEWWKNGPDADGPASDKIWLVKMIYENHPDTQLNPDDRIKEIISIVKGGIRPTAAYRDYQVDANFN